MLRARLDKGSALRAQGSGAGSGRLFRPSRWGTLRPGSAEPWALRPGEPWVRQTLLTRALPRHGGGLCVPSLPRTRRPALGRRGTHSGEELLSRGEGLNPLRPQRAGATLARVVQGRQASASGSLPGPSLLPPLPRAAAPAQVAASDARPACKTPFFPREAKAAPDRRQLWADLWPPGCGPVQGCAGGAL